MNDAAHLRSEAIQRFANGAMNRERKPKRQRRVQSHPKPEPPGRPVAGRPEAGETRRLAGVFAVFVQLGVVEPENGRA